MYNKGTKYLNAGKYEKALQCFKKQLVTHSFKELHLNMGNTYRWLNNDLAAYKSYLLANSPDMPFSDGTFTRDYPLALSNLGLLAYSQGKDEAAIAWYKQALTSDPLHYDAIWNYGNALLRSTNCSSRTGWDSYEYRFKRSTGAVVLDTSLPFWDGVSTGESIVVQTEQGLGDKIMFGRYLSWLKDYFKKIYVVCHESLDIFFSDYIIVRSLAETDSTVTIPLCSLARWFGIVDEKWLEGKFHAAEFNKQEFNIGIVWAGSPTHVNNANRSCPSHYFTALSDIGHLYSIAPGVAPTKNVTCIGSTDWSVTAATVLGLDCVVAVDTSIVHLCGTLGVDCIMVQPAKETDFRWGHGPRSVWYKSVEIVQNDWNWDKAMKEVRALLLARKEKLKVRLFTGITDTEWLAHFDSTQTSKVTNDQYGHESIERKTNV